MKQADVAYLWDDSVPNAGFIAIRPTKYGRMVYELMRDITNSSPSTDDQEALGQAIDRVNGLASGKFKSVALDKNRLRNWYFL